MANEETIYLDELGGASTGSQNAGPLVPDEGNAPPSDTIYLDELASSGGEGGFDVGEAAGKVGEFIGELARDTVEGAVAPIGAATATTKAILANPMFGVLPAEDEGAYWKEAGEKSIKGAAFWGSTLVGGRVLGMAAKPLWKAVAAGGAAAGTFELVNELPDFITKEIDSKDYFTRIASASTLGALTGGVIAKTPAGAKAGMDVVNKLIDTIPGGPRARTEVAKRLRETYTQASNKFFTSGVEVLRKNGLPELAEKLIISRGTGAMMGGRYVARFKHATQGFKEEEFELMGSLLDEADFNTDVGARIFAASDKVHYKDKFAADWSDEAFENVWHAARLEARALRSVGKMLQKAGLKTYDAINDEFHTFVMRKSYLPHRFNNPVLYRTGGKYRDETVETVGKQLGLERHDAEIWVDQFADRIEAEIGEAASGIIAPSSAPHYMQGRNMDLPGFERDVSKVLPQYYEHSMRRLANHALFGEVEISDMATRKAVQENLFTKEEMAALRPKDADEQLFIEEFRQLDGKGIKKTKIPEKEIETAREQMQARRADAHKELSHDLAVEMRYPRAFDSIEKIKDEELKKVMRNIVRRQLGAIDNPSFGERTLGRLAKLEVVTKLALGAIAQPSQMLSAVMRTGFKGSFRSLIKTIGNDAEALDFALRSGVILKGIVRTSEQSLTGKEGQEFLNKVFFTQLDLKSRVFGALQGRAYAEHMAQKLTNMVHKYGGYTNAPVSAQRSMRSIERKLSELGIDTLETVGRGGKLTNRDMLRAAQKISGDVNFWGDSLSLPEFYRSPYGKYITQFKSFGFQQGKLIKDQVIKPLARGEWGPMTRFALLMPLGGEIIADLKALARARATRFNGDEPEADTVVQRIGENIANAAGFGLVADAFEATRYGMGGALGFIAGPIGSTVGKTYLAGGAALRGDATKALRLGIETGVPAVTSIVAPAALPLVAAATPAVSNLLLPKKDKPN